MRDQPSTLRYLHAFRPAAAGAIEWEELPSLASRVRSRSASPSASTSAWDATRPAPLDAAPVSAPFREPIEGVSMREVIEPDVFAHFFGT